MKPTFETGDDLLVMSTLAGLSKGVPPNVTLIPAVLQSVPIEIEGIMSVANSPLGIEALIVSS